MSRPMSSTGAELVMRPTLSRSTPVRAYADTVSRSYDLAVPMGSDLRSAPQGSGAPRFVIIAEKDPLGAGLDRVQVVKGWLGEDGVPMERIYDVAWSGERTIDPATGLVPALPSTVDIAKATYDRESGAATLATSWQDPDFDKSREAFYYLRVLQVPTPRWTTYDAARYGAELPNDVPAELQERAYTSPIWYSPQE